jgi:hypothetical protein
MKPSTGRFGNIANCVWTQFVLGFQLLDPRGPIELGPDKFLE